MPRSTNLLAAWQLSVSLTLLVPGARGSGNFNMKLKLNGQVSGSVPQARRNRDCSHGGHWRARDSAVSGVTASDVTVTEWCH